MADLIAKMKDDATNKLVRLVGKARRRSAVRVARGARIPDPKLDTEIVVCWRTQPRREAKVRTNVRIAV